MKSNFLKSGEPFVWLTGGALAACLVMIAGVILVVAYHGFSFFWPKDLVQFESPKGTPTMGQVWERQPSHGRVQLKVGNRDLYGSDFKWIDVNEGQSSTRPEGAIVFERREWGDFYGFLTGIYQGDRRIAGGGLSGWPVLLEQIDQAHQLYEQIRSIEAGELADIHQQIEEAVRRQSVQGDHSAELESARARYEDLGQTITAMRERLNAVEVEVTTADGRTTRIMTGDIVRAHRPNDIGLVEKLWVYVDRAGEFVLAEPREANTEGGVFPAIFGTVLMVFLMSLAAVPFGVLAALYLREYAKQGPLVRMIRIAVNNLAGVPSIVFGMFGLGFFVYGIGGTIDQLFFPEQLPAPTYGTGGILWASLTLALLTVPVMIVSTEEALSAVTRDVREGSLALGATKFQTILRVVLPGALPGILTGIILVIARGAGEVAPLMITGVVKLAPSLPIDASFPFVHLERKFMHLGFHIYDVGFQSPNVEAARPMVYTTTLLLIGIVLLLNFAAIKVRSRVRSRLTGSVV
jgi:phosphate transport system permease protein